MQSLKKALYIIACFATILTPIPSYAGNLIGIVVANTLPEANNQGRRNDVKNMVEEMRSISELTGMELDSYVYIDYEYNSNLLKELEKIHVENDDVVFFFYSGHGYREYDKDPDANPWPNLHISLENKGIDHAVITEIFEEKHPRLLLSLVNSCNNKVSFPIPLVKRSLSMMAEDSLYKRELKKLNYRRLFLETRGKIVASSSIPGQVSYRNIWTGSIFHSSFLSALHEETENQEVTDWDIIFQSTSDKIFYKTRNSYGGPQIAQYQIETY